mmetsp:Transcript_46862/g.105654  ORF Transcript_46862/g.105654 Transcript_46862/m.105654 type:complete len:257 (-) Transcript_46862:193-963(-)
MLKRPRGTADDELHSIAAGLPVAQRYTDWWDHLPADGSDQGISEHSSLDHLLVSSPLFQALDSVQIDHTHQPMDVSDHWPIVATFDLASLVTPPAAPPAAPAAEESHGAKADAIPSTPPRGVTAGIVTPSTSTLPLDSIAGLAAHAGSAGAPRISDGLAVCGALVVIAVTLLGLGCRRARRGRCTRERADLQPTSRTSSSSPRATAPGATVAELASTSAWELNDAARAAAAATPGAGDARGGGGQSGAAKASVGVR